MPKIAESKLTALISANPKAGRRSSRALVERLVDELQKRGFETETHTDLQDVSRRANELFMSGKLRALIGVGGDGTAAELVNRTDPGVPITLLPAGTANLIARYLKLPKNPQKCAQMIASGETLTLDAGVANGRLFLIMASAGVDAQIVNYVDADRRRRYEENPSDQGGHIGYASYVRPLFKAAKTYPFPQIKLEVLDDAGASEEKGNVVENAARTTILGRWSLVFNLPQYGWGLPLSPGCLGSDGLLNHCVFTKGKLFSELVGALFAQFGSAHRFLPSVKLGKSAAYRLSAVDASGDSIPYQLDGDPCGYLPLEIRSIPRRFTVLTSKNIAQKLKEAQID